MSATNLQASPLAKGLFVRIFGMSGTTLKGGAGAGVPLAQAEGEGVKLQTAMKATSIADMRSFSSDKVTALAQQAGVRAMPDIDGYYLPQDVDAIFAAGQQSDVAVVTGSTANDIGTQVPIRKAQTVAEYKDAAKQMFGDKADQFLKLFPVKNDADARQQADYVGRNSGFAIGARNWVRAQSKTGKQPAYLFMVTKVQPFTPGVTFSDFDPATAGAYHMGDVPYFLGTYEAFNLFRPTRNWTDADRDLSNKMQDSIIAFARTGNPATAAVKFVRWQPANETRVLFGDTISVEKLNSKQMDFLVANPPAPPQRGAGRGGPPPSPGVPPSPSF
jgi:para-nitrobenzyl esterase